MDFGRIETVFVVSRKFGVSLVLGFVGFGREDVWLCVV